eukprot:94570-Pyramimonas_sp.AAC.1
MTEERRGHRQGLKQQSLRHSELSVIEVNPRLAARVQESASSPGNSRAGADADAEKRRAERAPQ